MEWLNTVKEIVQFFAILVGAGSIFYAAKAYVTSAKQFHHEVMIRCIERFQAIINDLGSQERDKKVNALRKYIDLCNEELFYFKGKYVPEEVAVEWLDGMIGMLPLFGQDGEVIAKGKAPEILANSMLDGYPRVQKAFRVTKAPDMGDARDRKRCIDEILVNLKKLSYPCA